MEENEDVQKDTEEKAPAPEAPVVVKEEPTEIKQEAEEPSEPHEVEGPAPPEKPVTPPEEEKPREAPEIKEIKPEPKAEPHHDESVPAEPEQEPPREERPKAVSVDDQLPPQEQERRSSKRISIEKGQDSFIPPVGGRERRSTDIGAYAIDSKFGFGKPKIFGNKGKVLGSVLDIKSNVADAYDKRSARYQNTYRLESENPFNAEKVDKILKEVMEEALNNLQYDPDKCPSQAKWAVTQIRGKVRQFDFDRYKLVCIVTIGEKNSQDVYSTCRFLWDAEKDHYAYYSLENTYVYGIAYCFGLYYE